MPGPRPIPRAACHRCTSTEATETTHSFQILLTLPYLLSQPFNDHTGTHSHTAPEDRRLIKPRGLQYNTNTRIVEVHCRQIWAIPRDPSLIITFCLKPVNPTRHRSNFTSQEETIAFRDPRRVGSRLEDKFSMPVAGPMKNGSPRSAWHLYAPQLTNSKV